ncbi:MAG: DUF4203 domain-containing protein [Thermotogae bacterium]|nr:DUF4203 domain-containing protein [Thermotogota bacterium]
MTVNIKGIIESILITLQDYWYLALPISLLLLFAGKIMKNLVIALLGFSIGALGVSPYVMNFLLSNPSFSGIESYKMWIVIIVGVIFAILMFSLVKIAIFLAAFFAGASIGSYIYSPLEKIINIPANIKQWLVMVIPLAIGILAGILSFFYSEKILDLLAILTGALLTTFSIFMLLNKYFGLFQELPNKINDVTGMLMMSTFLVLFILGVVVNSKMKVNEK